MGGRTLWVCLQTFSRKLKEAGHTLNVAAPPPHVWGGGPHLNRKEKESMNVHIHLISPLPAWADAV